jgi:plastocyanin
MRVIPRILASLFLAASAVACGGGGDDGGDDMQNPDAPPVTQNVSMVACAGGEPTVMTPGNNYSPMTTTISAGESVRFTLGATHNLVSTTAGQTFSLPIGADACLRFAAAGTYTFRCMPHGFTGSVVAQ